MVFCPVVPSNISASLRAVNVGKCFFVNPLVTARILWIAGIVIILM